MIDWTNEKFDWTIKIRKSKMTKAYVFKSSNGMEYKIFDDFLGIEEEKNKNSKMWNRISEAIEHTFVIKTVEGITAIRGRLVNVSLEADTGIELVSSPRSVPIEDRMRDTKIACEDFIGSSYSYKEGLGPWKLIENAIEQLKNCLAEW